MGECRLHISLDAPSAVGLSSFLYNLADFSLAVSSDEAPVRIPISVKFEIPYFTVSGIQVRYLKIVEKSGYQALPWVRVRCVRNRYNMPSFATIFADPTRHLHSTSRRMETIILFALASRLLLLRLYER